MEPEASASAGRSVSSMSQLSGSALSEEALGLGVSAARAVQIARRVLTGQDLTEAERQQLLSIHQRLLDVADSVDYAQSAGERGRGPRYLTSVGLTTDALEQQTPSEGVTVGVRRIADALKQLTTEQDKAAAKVVHDFFIVLTDVVASHVGSPGDRVLGG
jgi:hypothetical protein